jgi:hypothetical protein
MNWNSVATARAWFRNLFGGVRIAFLQTVFRRHGIVESVDCFQVLQFV